MQWLFKPLTSALFVAAALAQRPGDAFVWHVLAGLALSWIGDVALIPRSRRWFLAGLAAFLLGHVAYIAAFAERASFGQAPPAAVAVSVAVSLAFFAYLRPLLGKMLWPVAAYVAVITLMVIGATAAWSAGQGSTAAWLIVTGATLFYRAPSRLKRESLTRSVGVSPIDAPSRLKRESLTRSGRAAR